ncbi:MAG: ImmA/IrrE family metallo-endopeptidase [Flavobacteriales bacterium]
MSQQRVQPQHDILRNLMQSMESDNLADQELDERLKSFGLDPTVVVSKGLAAVERIKAMLPATKESKAQRSATKQTRQWSHPSVVTLLRAQGADANADAVNIVKSMARQVVLDAYTAGWSGPPFNLIDLAQMRDIEVVPNEVVLDARIIPVDPQRFLIEYNPFQSETRINFSIAHEIGHTLFPDCRDFIRNREAQPERDSWELEFLCNVAAAEILLPYALFSADAVSAPMTIDGITELAKKYKASLESVLLRFIDVIEAPATMAIARFTDDPESRLIVDYSKATVSSKTILQRGFIIPHGSKAYECVRAGWTAHGLETWPEGGGKEFRVFAIGLGSLRRHQTQRVGLFLIPDTESATEEHLIHTVSGDATEPRGSGRKIIAQIVNTSAAMGSGFGKSLGARYPRTKEELKLWKKEGEGFGLGAMRMVDLGNDIYVAQMVAQEGLYPKGNTIPLRYSSLRLCIKQLAAAAEAMNASVHMPYIGAGLAGGNWDIIKGVILEELVLKGIDVTVYRLPGKSIPKPPIPPVGLFD